MPVSSGIRASGWRQHLHPLTVLFIYRHKINWGCRDEKWHLAKHLPTQPALCLKQGLCSMQWEGGWARGAGSVTWTSQLVDQKALPLSVAEPPLPSKSSISIVHPPWSSHGQPLTWKGSRKLHVQKGVSNRKRREKVGATGGESGALQGGLSHLGVMLPHSMEEVLQRP